MVAGETWTLMFKETRIEKWDEQLDEDEMTDPENNLVRLILYIYSLDSFLFSAVDYALKSGDMSKTSTLGPYAKILGSALRSASERRKDLVPFGPHFKVSLYRGGLLSEPQIEEYRKIVDKKDFVQLIGHVSATTNKETALEHILDKKLEDGLKPVLFHLIRWDSPKCYYVVDQSPFPYEQEVLLHDGVRLFVLAMDEKEEEGKMYTVITLKNW